MIWDVIFWDAAQADLHRIGYRTAESVCMSVQAFATTGEGSLALIDEERGLWELVAARGHALLRLDAQSKTIHVLRLYSHYALPRVEPLLDTPAEDEDSQD